MGDCRIQIRYVGRLASNVDVGCVGVGSSNDNASASAASAAAPKAEAAAATPSTTPSIIWVATPSADTSLRELVNVVLSDLDRGLPTAEAPGVAVGVVPSFGSGTDAILPPPPPVGDGGRSNAATAATSTAAADTAKTQQNQLHLYDITLHPYRNVTPIILSQPDVSGVNSITLQNLGWYPSARLAVCYADDDADDDDEDVRDLIGGYCGVDAEVGVDIGGDGDDGAKPAAAPAMMVRLTGNVGGDGTDAGMGDGYRPKPSQIMASVTDRDVGGSASIGNDDDNDAANAHTERIRKATEQRQKEERRTARLDETIRRIDQRQDEKRKRSSSSSSSNAKVSAQVKRMLIKSRAIGAKSLREEDRFYLEVVHVDDDRVGGGKDDDDDNNNSDNPSHAPSYRYFSRVATAGQVASTASAPRPMRGDKTTTTGTSTLVELLVKIPARGLGGGEGDYYYRRLPNLMPLHQAEEGGFLNQFDRVVVRAYGVNDDATCSISVDDVKTQHCHERADAGASSANDSDGAGDSDVGEEVAKGDDAMDDDEGGRSSSTQADPTLCERISMAIEEAEAVTSSSSAKGKTGKKKKKKSATSDKVRQMLIKMAGFSAGNWQEIFN